MVLEDNNLLAALNREDRDLLARSADFVEFKAGKVLTSLGLHYVPYERTYRGIPVVGGDFVVQTDDSGRVLATSVAQTRQVTGAHRGACAVVDFGDLDAGRAGGRAPAAAGAPVHGSVGRVDRPAPGPRSSATPRSAISISSLSARTAAACSVTC